MTDIRLEYVTPGVVTYRDSEILKQMPVKVVGGTPVAPQNFLEISITDPGKRKEGYRGISTRSLLEDPDE